MDLCFTTLGCPDWDLETLCRLGPELGYQGVDFRGLQGDLDITRLPAFTTGLASTRRRLQDAGLRVSCISSSLSVCEPEKLEQNLEEARRTIPIAEELDCGLVRVFGNGDAERHSLPELADFGRGCVERLLQLDGAGSLRWIFETHDRWIRGVDCRLLLERIPAPQFGVLWDIGHTSRVGGETPAQTWTAVGERVAYAHLKDAVHEPQHPLAMADGWRYVPPGTGQLPLAEAVALLRRHAYDGWLMFEHEKRWHSELEDPEVIFPLFVRWIRPLLG